jgi:3-hydroxybutyryl-CoA dehydrogenase
LKVLVAGPGTIGASLALTCAIHGHSVTLLGRREASLANARKLISLYASELEDADLAPVGYEGWQDRLTMTIELRDVPMDCDIAIEAINENLTAKQELIAALEAHLHEDAVLASSTSGLPVDQIAASSTRTSQFAVAHFANPPHLMPVVEVVPGSNTSPNTIAAIETFVQSLSKTPVLLNHDVAGHLFNRIQFAMLREAIALVEKGIATPKQIDTVVKRGLALRLAEEGPLEKIDLAGLQLVHDVATYLYPQLDNSEEPGLLKKMLAEDKGGAKSGQGFFTWNAEREARTLTRRNAEVIRHLQRLKKEE